MHQRQHELTRNDQVAEAIRVEQATRKQNKYLHQQLKQVINIEHRQSNLSQYQQETMEK